MAVNISGLRRNLKNVAHNYTDAQVKVREATSNDPWGPSSTMMSEIADLTYNVVAFSEIMQMVWKRLNDHGKNWRHVYKALVLLEYLIKTGSEKVAQQCKENIFAIQTLKDFQYLDDNKDQGINVREKAKALVALLKDDERLKNERVRALKAKERFAQSTAGIGSDTVYNHGRERAEANLRQAGSDYEVSAVAAAGANGSELEAARPQTVGEEELQLQLALAMSREEAEQEETKTKSDDIRLQMALQKSKADDEAERTNKKPSNDLLDLDFGNPTAAVALTPPAPSPPPPVHMPAPPTRTAASALNDPWGMPQQQQEAAPAQNDPWGASPSAATQQAAAPAANSDPWSPVGASAMAASASPVNLGAANRTSPMPAGFAIQRPNENQPPPAVNDPWNPVSGTSPVPPPPSNEMRASPAAAAAMNTESLDLFSPQAQNQLQEFDMLRGQIEDGPAAPPSNGNNGNGGTTSPNPFDMGDLSGRLGDNGGMALMPSSTSPANGASTGAKPKTSTVQTILGEHSNLVNLDNLVSESGAKAARNPFEQQTPNPFQAKAQKPPMKDLLAQNNPGATGWSAAANQQQQQQQQQQEMNPFF